MKSKQISSFTGKLRGHLNQEEVKIEEVDKRILCVIVLK